jgi:hypothetical protein
VVSATDPVLASHLNKAGTYEWVVAALSALNVLNSRTKTVLVGSYRSTTPKWGVDDRWQMGKS